MLKEIHDQVAAASDTVRGRIGKEEGKIFFDDIGLDADKIANIDRIVFVSCGTAWHACLVAKFYIEDLVGIPCEVDYASEFRYRKPTLSKNCLLYTSPSPRD